MSVLKKSLISMLAAAMLIFASCGGSNGNADNTTQSTDSITTTIQTDSEGGYFTSFGEYKYYTNGKEASIVTYLGNDTKITLPDKCKDIPVVSVAWSAFSKNGKLEEVTVPDTIRVLGVSAFAECTALKKVTLSDSVTKIDINCFSGCTALTEFNLTKGMTDLGISAFSKCASLSKITCDKENETFLSDNGVIYSKDRTKLILYPAGKEDEAYTVNEMTVAVSDRAFEGNIFIKTVDLKNVTDIGSYSFKDCTNLLNVKHDKTMTVAGGAFENTFYEAINTTASLVTSETN